MIKTEEEWIMHKEFTFEAHDEERNGVIATGNYSKRDKDTFKAMYKADIVFCVGTNEHDVYLQKNRFIDETIKVTIEATHVFMYNLMINYPEVRVFNDNNSNIDELLKEPISINVI